MATVNLDTSVRLDIVCRKGDTFTLPVDFQTTQTADGFSMQVRLTDTTEDNVILEAESFSVSDGTATNSTLTITISADNMAEIDSGLYVYDLQNTDSSGVVSTKLFGTFKVNEDITV